MNRRTPLEVVAIMTCDTSAGDEAGRITAMLYRAADLGADGIVLNAPSGTEAKSDDERPGRRLCRMGTPAGVADQCVYRAQAIRFK
jgi:hypothetical protein